MYPLPPRLLSLPLSTKEMFFRLLEDVSTLQSLHIKVK